MAHCTDTLGYLFVFEQQDISTSLLAGREILQMFVKVSTLGAKKLSPARNDVLEAEGWSARCAEVAFFTKRFREVKTTRCCLRLTIDYSFARKMS